MIDINDMTIRYSEAPKHQRYKRLLFGGVKNKQLTLDEIIEIHKKSFDFMKYSNEKVFLDRLFPSLIICEKTNGAKTYVELDHLDRRIKAKDK